MQAQLTGNLFVKTLGYLQYGVTEERLNAALLECIDAAKETNKSAKLVFTLTIMPENGGAQIEIKADISSKLPKLPAPKTLFFSTDNDPLTRIDPKQRELPDLRAVDDERPTEFKTASN